MVVALLLGVNPSDVIPQSQGGYADSGVEAPGADLSQCKTGADANANVDCRVAATVTSVDGVWQQLLPGYTRPHVRLFQDQVNTGCGPATSDVGPFYCPVDKTAYFDTGFFQVLHDQFGSSNGPLAQEYVVAHEFGHHVQDLQGTLGRAQQGATGAGGNGVRTELLGPLCGDHQAAGHRCSVPRAVDRQGHCRCAVGGVVRRRRPDSEGRYRTDEPRVLDARFIRGAAEVVHDGLPDR